MPSYLFGNTTVNLPNTGASPAWSPAILEAFAAISAALSGVVTAGDISKQSMELNSSQNPATDVTIPGMSFSTTIVRAGFIQYSVFRETDSTSVTEAGQIMVVYNADNSVGVKWDLQRQAVGDASIDFEISDAGQFSFTTSAISGSNHSGLISFVGTALLQE